MKKVTIKISVSNIKVSQSYYSFDYDVRVNGKKVIENEEYESDHVWGHSEAEMKRFKKVLVDGEAIKIVLERISNEDFF
jgi:hypothetical protein